jgi:ubiquinone/menaquinone biosynthesis C-methylase UbiE
VTNSPADTAEIAAFYALGLERERLTTGQGALELARTQALLERYLPPPPAEVLDAGGGPGRYAVWLAERGYRVHLIDLVPLHVEQARTAASARPEASLASAEVGDARVLSRRDESMDAVLLLGPLYHLTETSAREQALAEARRVCRRGGVVIAAVISRFASTLDGIRGSLLEDPVFAAVTEEARLRGQHRNPTGNPAYFTTAYFHLPGELESELTSAGLTHEATLGVEGPALFLADLHARLADERRRTALLEALAAIEGEPTLLGASAHWLGIARRP